MRCQALPSLSFSLTKRMKRNFGAAVSLDVALQWIRSCKCSSIALLLHEIEGSDVESILLSVEIAVESVWPSRLSRRSIRLCGAR